jgi:hypothetical protein
LNDAATSLAPVLETIDETLIDRVFPLAALVLAVLFVALHMAAFTEVSLYDEATHADYALAVSHGSLPKTGDQLDQRILREWSCRGAFDDDVLPPCNSERFDPADYFADGTNYNGQHPPAYYAVAGLYARAATDGLGVDSFVGAARTFGALTLALGMTLLHRAIRAVGVSPFVAAAAALLPLTNANFVHLHSTVNNDAALLPLAAAVLLLGIRAAQGRGPSWALPAVALAAGLTKLTAAFPAVTAGLVLVALGMAVQGDDVARRRMRIGTITMVVAAAPPILWALLDRARRSPDWVNPLSGENTRPVRGNPLAEIFTDPFAVLPTARPPFIAPEISSAVLDAWVLFSGALLLVGVIGLALHRNRELRLAGQVQILALLAIPPFVQLLIVATSGEYFASVSPRYGLAMLPGVFASLAVVLDDGRLTRRVVPAATAVGILIVFAGLI